jgi:putative MATE family efflux protein
MHIDLTQGDIGKHIRTLAIPASIGFFFHTMFNVTDTWFAGEISTQALAALSLSFPIFFLIISIAGGMSEAVTAVVGNTLGEGKKDEAQHIAQNGLVFGAFLAIGLTIVGYLSAPFLMTQLGARDDYLLEALGYINIIIYGTGLFVFAFFINSMLNAVGDTVSFRNILIVSALLNVVLDYWFVNGGMGIEPMGVEGIAYATVIIEALSVLYLWYRLSRTPLFTDMCSFNYDITVIRELMAQGMPPSVNMALTAIGIYIITYFAAPFGQEVVAAFGIGMRIEQIILMPAIGLNVAVLAIVAQNNGGMLHHRIVETVDKALGYGALLALFGGGILLGASDVVMGLFSDDRSVIVEGAIYLRIEALIIYPFVMLFTYVAMLQGIKRPTFIFYLSIARQIVAPIIVLAVLAWLGMGVVSIWLGIAAIVTVAALITRWYALRELDALEHQHGLVEIEKG